MRRTSAVCGSIIILRDSFILVRADVIHQETQEKSICVSIENPNSRSKVDIDDDFEISGYHHADLALQAKKREDKSENWRERCIAYVCHYLHGRLKSNLFGFAGTQNRFAKVKFAAEVLRFLKTLPENMSDMTSAQRGQWRSYYTDVATKNDGNSLSEYVKPIEEIIQGLFKDVVTQAQAHLGRLFLVDALPGVKLYAQCEVDVLVVSKVALVTHDILDILYFCLSLAELQAKSRENTAVSLIAAYIVSRIESLVNADATKRFAKLKIASEVLKFLNELTQRTLSDISRATWENLYKRAQESEGEFFKVVQAIDKKLVADFGAPDPEKELGRHAIKNVGIRLFSQSELSYFSGGDSKFGLAAECITLPTLQELQAIQEPEDYSAVKQKIRFQMAKYLLSVVYGVGEDSRKVSMFGGFRQRFVDIKTAIYIYNLYAHEVQAVPKNYADLLLNVAALMVPVGGRLADYLKAIYAPYCAASGAADSVDGARRELEARHNTL